MNLSDFVDEDNAALRDLIESRIRAKGSIDFAEFMELALYHPELGYYMFCDPAMDYQSSPNVHPVFGAVLARQLAESWRLMGRPSRFEALEAGAGSGRLAGDILRALQRQEPDLYDAIDYRLQDVSYGLGSVASRVAASLPANKTRLMAEMSAAGSIQGCILSNELLDALPFHRVRMSGGKLLELWVGLKDGGVVDAEVDAPQPILDHFQALGILPAEGCVAEVCLKAPDWVNQASGALERGFLLTLDYGYEAVDLYAPWRKAGTLLTFYRHTSGDDPYRRIGRQDITASIDFTSVMAAAGAAHLKTERLNGQAEYLVELGIGEALSRPPEATQLEAYYSLRRAIVELTDLAGLGRIKVWVASKGVSSGR